VPHDDAVFEGDRVEQGAGEDVQRIEPAAGLVDRLGDEVGGEADRRALKRVGVEDDLLRGGSLAPTEWLAP